MVRISYLIIHNHEDTKLSYGIQGTG
jgi:hypothetical protein